MTLRSPLVATAFLVGAIGFGLAIAGLGVHQQADGGEVAAGVAQPAASKQDRTRVTCYNGAKYGRDDLYRGWFCVPEGKEPVVN